MNLTIENIFVNCIRDLSYYYALFSYICTECIKAIHNSNRISFHLPVNSGGWFFYCADRCLFRLYSMFSLTPIYSAHFYWFRVSESGITGRSVFLAFQTRKESPNFRPYGLLDQANRMLANGNHPKEIIFQRGFFFFLSFCPFSLFFLLKQWLNT